MISNRYEKVYFILIRNNFLSVSNMLQPTFNYQIGFLKRHQFRNVQNRSFVLDRSSMNKIPTVFKRLRKPTFYSDEIWNLAQQYKETEQYIIHLSFLNVGVVPVHGDYAMLRCMFYRKIFHVFQRTWCRWFTSLDHVAPRSSNDLDHPTMQEKQVSHGY